MKKSLILTHSNRFSVLLFPFYYYYWRFGIWYSSASVNDLLKLFSKVMSCKNYASKVDIPFNNLIANISQMLTVSLTFLTHKCNQTTTWRNENI